MNKKEKVVLYEWMRLIATIFVVIGHSSYIAMSTSLGGVSYIRGPETSPVYFSDFFMLKNAIGDWVYGFHMPLFFFLSGAVLAIKPIGRFDKFVVNKIKRLIIPFFGAGILFLLPVKWIGDFYTDDTFLQAIGMFLNGEESGHLWFLPALFWSMIIFVILQKAVEKYASDSQMLLWILSWILSMSISLIPFNNFQFRTGISYIFWFSTGWVFEKYVRKLWDVKCSIVALLLTIVLSIINTKMTIFTKDAVIVIGIIMTIALSYILCVLLGKYSGNMLYNVLMRNLFNIYLYHDPLNYIVLKVTFKFNIIESGLGCYIYMFSRTIGVMIGSIIIGETLHIILTKLKSVHNA